MNNKRMLLLLITLFCFKPSICNIAITKQLKETTNQLKVMNNDVETCVNKQDCLGKIDKHLLTLKQMQSELTIQHMNQPPYALPTSEVNGLLFMNFIPAIGYLLSKLYDYPTGQSGTRYAMAINTYFWSIDQWVNFRSRKAILVEIDLMIKSLEHKKKTLEQES